MTTSKRDLEGYFMLDNRNGPGLSEELVHVAGLPKGAGRGLFEAPSYTCSHCHAQVVMNPARTRERGYCKKCDRYVCDACEARRLASGGECKPLNVVIDELREAALKKSVVV